MGPVSNPTHCNALAVAPLTLAMHRLPLKLRQDLDPVARGLRNTESHRGLKIRVFAIGLCLTQLAAKSLMDFRG